MRMLTSCSVGKQPFSIGLVKINKEVYQKMYQLSSVLEGAILVMSGFAFVEFLEGLQIWPLQTSKTVTPTGGVCLAIWKW